MLHAQNRFTEIDSVANGNYDTTVIQYKLAR